MSRARSGISKTDMEASRLVFVFVRDAKVKRKVAVPVPDGYTWAEFIQQVTTKLKIAGIKEIFLASSGHVLTQLDELQDIDELCVVEGPAAPAQHGLNGGSPPSSSEAAFRSGNPASTSGALPHQTESTSHQIMSPGRHKVAITDGAGASATAGDDERKYSKRIRPWRRVLQRLLPSIFAPGLPVSAKDVDTDDKGGSGRARKRRRGVVTAGNGMLLLLIVFSMSTMLYFFFFAKVEPTPP